MSTLNAQRSTLNDQIHELNTRIDDYNLKYIDSYHAVESSGGNISNSFGNLLNNGMQATARLYNSNGFGRDARAYIANTIEDIRASAGINQGSSQDNIEDLTSIATVNHLLIQADRTLDRNQDASFILDESQQILVDLYSRLP
jgi:hypothetical protein